MLSALGKRARPGTPEPIVKGYGKYEGEPWVESISWYGTRGDEDSNPMRYVDGIAHQAWRHWSNEMVVGPVYRQYASIVNAIPLTVIERIQRWWRQMLNRMRTGFIVD